MFMSASKNRFSLKVKGKSDFELDEIVQNQNQYMPEMVLAAFDELEFRKGFMDEKKKEFITSEKLKEQSAQARKLKKVSSIPEDLPNSIRNSAILIYISAALSVTVNLITFSGVLSLNGILLAALGFMVHKGSNGWRWVLTILFGLGTLISLISLSYDLVNGFSFHISLLSLTQTLIQLSAVVLLFLPESRNWYRGLKGEQVEEDEFIFRD